MSDERRAPNAGVLIHEGQEDDIAIDRKLVEQLLAFQTNL